jgi:hypothetical protein
MNRAEVDVIAVLNKSGPRPPKYRNRPQPTLQEQNMKGTFLSLALLAMLSMAACTSSQSESPSATAGDAYKDVNNIYTIYIMPVELPDEIHGNASDEEKERWQNDWQMVGARLIARAVTDEAGDRVVASARERRPDADFYFVLKITYLDVGDADVRSAGIFDSDERGWSHVLAVGRIVRSDNGDTVAELTFDQSSGKFTKEPFQNDMSNLGQELGNWIVARQ